MHIINVYLRGGAIQHLTIPQGSAITVRVVDYDCEGADCPDSDDKGNTCSIEIYQARQEAV